MKAIVFASVFVVALALSYGITAGLLWLVCLCFGWSWWSWQVAAGVWLVLVAVRLALRSE